VDDDHETEVLAVEAGCTLCHGAESAWVASNAMAVAAQHARRYGHPTWVRQTIEVHYGASPPKQKEHLPGFEPVPAAGTASVTP
jgi:hypothetical protein